ncbi:hypothetical protein H9P43_001675 [Blastocladiella emersonii ATCC 22665]|nr:hypothetical protein H9P43_001675 [Blastocladiella emersonii ATCC 22665]
MYRSSLRLASSTRPLLAVSPVVPAMRFAAPLATVAPIAVLGRGYVTKRPVKRQQHQARTPKPSTTMATSSAVDNLPAAPAAETPAPPAATTPALLADTPAVPAAAAPASFMDKLRAFFAKNYHGVCVLLKEDYPRYRAQQLIPESQWTRRDHVFMSRVRSDLRTLAPFAVFVLLLPEAIPFLILRGMVPSTCLDASDVAKARAKRVPVRDRIAGNLVKALTTRKTVSGFNPASLTTAAGVRDITVRYGAEFDPRGLKRKQLAFCLDFLGVSPLFPHPFGLAARLARTVAELEADDRRIVAEGGPRKLTDAELAAASEARGVSTVATDGRAAPSRAQLEAYLATWIEMNTATKPGVPKPLVVFARIVQYERLARALEGKA